MVPVHHDAHISPQTQCRFPHSVTTELTRERGLLVCCSASYNEGEGIVLLPSVSDVCAFAFLILPAESPSHFPSFSHSSFTLISSLHVRHYIFHAGADREGIFESGKNSASSAEWSSGALGLWPRGTLAARVKEGSRESLRFKSFCHSFISNVFHVRVRATAEGARGTGDRVTDREWVCCGSPMSYFVITSVFRPRPGLPLPPHALVLEGVNSFPFVLHSCCWAHGVWWGLRALVGSSSFLLSDFVCLLYVCGFCALSKPKF